MPDSFFLKKRNTFFLTIVLQLQDYVCFHFQNYPIYVNQTFAIQLENVFSFLKKPEYLVPTPKIMAENFQDYS